MATMATPVGAVYGAGVAVASLGVRDKIGSLVAAGKESRGVSENERYHFGDFTRGVTRHMISNGDDKKNEKKSENAKAPVLKDKKRLAGVGGMSVGAVVGGILLGPVGLVAGSLVGSRLAKATVSDQSGDVKGEETLRKDEGFDDTEGSRDSHDTNLKCNK